MIFDVSKFSIIHKLRRKYSINCDKYNSDHLDRLLWWSFPCVYIRGEYNKAAKDYQKLVQKRKRYKKYIHGMVDTFGEIYLLTLTFSDDVYDSTTSTTKKKYVQRYLDEICSDFYACLDIGAKNGREHYHCIVALKTSCTVEKVDKHLQVVPPWYYGYHNIKPICIDGKNFHASVNYCFKAAAYSFKSSNSSIRPFHKRGVVHFNVLDSEIRLL